MALFRSTQNTAACAGGFRYRPMLGPDACHHHVRDPQRRPQFACAPVRRAIAGGLARPGQHPRLQPGRVIGRGAAAMPSVQTSEPLSFEAALPTADVIGGAGQLQANRTPAHALIEHHDQPRTLHISRSCTARTRQRLQRGALFRSPGPWWSQWSWPRRHPYGNLPASRRRYRTVTEGASGLGR